MQKIQHDWSQIKKAPLDESHYMLRYWHQFTWLSLSLAKIMPNTMTMTVQHKKFKIFGVQLTFFAKSVLGCKKVSQWFQIHSVRFYCKMQYFCVANGSHLGKWLPSWIVGWLTGFIKRALPKECVWANFYVSFQKRTIVTVICSANVVSPDIIISATCTNFIF